MESDLLELDLGKRFELPTPNDGFACGLGRLTELEVPKDYDKLVIH